MNFYRKSGVFITLSSIVDFRQNITSFPDLINRVILLIEETKEEDKVRFMSFTPAIGSLALPDYHWDDLKKVITSKRSTTKIDMICMNENDLKKFHDSFLGRQTNRGKVDSALINEINSFSLNLIKNHFGDVGESIHEITNLPSSKLPGYYLFANKNKAIIASPLFLPMPHNELPKEIIINLPNVTMFGIETKDPAIISSAIRMFEIYKQL